MVGGYYYKRLKTQELPSETCPGCGTKGGMALESGCRVHHELFIPVWANKKCVFLLCQVCNGKYHIPENSPLSDMALSMYENTRYRWYHYIGTIFIISLIATFALLIYSGEKERKDELLSEVKNISAGNVIYYKLNSKEKTSMYVDKVVNDTVFVRENKLLTNQNVSAIDRKNNYTDKQTFYLKPVLLEMHKQDKIIKIYQSNIILDYEDL